MFLQFKILITKKEKKQVQIKKMKEIYLKHALERGKNYFERTKNMQWTENGWNEGERKYQGNDYNLFIVHISKSQHQSFKKRYGIIIIIASFTENEAL